MRVLTGCSPVGEYCPQVEASGHDRRRVGQTHIPEVASLSTVGPLYVVGGLSRCSLGTGILVLGQLLYGLAVSGEN